MKIFNKLSSLSKKRSKTKGQVFILATLIIVVYTVSIIAVVTELSVDRTKTDEVNLTHIVNEYLSEMHYQLEMGLYNYIKNSLTPNAVISSLQTFISSFSLYAASKGVDTSINLRQNEFSISAKQSGSPISVINFPPDFNQTIFISLNSSINFQSSNSGSKVTGLFIHYYAINAFISNGAQTSLFITEKDFYGNILEYITGVTFSTPATAPTDNGNGNYDGSFGGGIDFTIPSGIEFIS